MGKRYCSCKEEKKEDKKRTEERKKKDRYKYKKISKILRMA
jgi:hypothetical protein